MNHNSYLVLFLVGLVCLTFNNQLSAQVNVNFQYPSKTHHFGINNLLYVSLHNLSNVQAEVKPKLKVSDANGIIVLELDISSIIINGFSRHTLTSNSYHLSYIHPDYIRHISIYNRLPAGFYEICLNIECLSGECREFNERLHLPCRKIQVESFYQLVLNYPVNRSELKDNRPMFNWTLTGQLDGSQDIRYNIEVFEVEKMGASIQSTGYPVVYLQRLTNSQAGYHLHKYTFQKDHQYAWRVTAFIDDEMIATSDIWYFYLSDEILQGKHNTRSYAVLKKQPDASYYSVTDGKVYIKLRERYNEVNIPDISIVDLSRKVEILPDLSEIKAQRPENTDLPAYIKDIGDNKFILDLTSYGLDKGFYILKFTDSLKNNYYLKIKIY